MKIQAGTGLVLILLLANSNIFCMSNIRTATKQICLIAAFYTTVLATVVNTDCLAKNIALQAEIIDNLESSTCRLMPGNSVERCIIHGIIECGLAYTCVNLWNILCPPHIRKKIHLQPIIGKKWSKFTRKRK